MATSIILGRRDITQCFDKRSLSKSIGNNIHSRFNQLSNQHKRYKSQQRQLKGIVTLGEIKSKQVQNIKISRLNDLAMKEENGNPLMLHNKIKQEIELRSSTQPVGGVKTHYL